MAGKPTLDVLEPMDFGSAPLPFDSPEWGFEIKYDGCRVLASTGRDVRLKTRRGADATVWFGEVAQSLEQLASGSVIDGEVTVLDEHGRSDYPALQARTRARRWREGMPTVVLCAFDLLVYKGRDISSRPLLERKRALREVLKMQPASILYVEHIVGEGRWLFEQVVALQLEGMVAKRLASPYRAGERTRDWLKVKRKASPSGLRIKT